MNPHELSTLDRTTLRTWRIANLVVGGLAAAGAFLLIVMALLMGSNLLPEGDGEAPLWIGIAMAIVYLAIPSGAAGLVAGARVYRSPVVVAGLAVTLAELLVVSFMGLAGGVLFQLIGAAIVVTVAGFAAFVARWRWRRRPEVLRQTPSRINRSARIALWAFALLTDVLLVMWLLSGPTEMRFT